ncbi:MAG: pilus assembly protein PilX [Lachnospiraceae bacterium]|nr:pilus assembly protein PilX [Lachnospiraceae bacterium]
MRKWNAALSMGIVVLFFVHAVTGGFQLMGIMPGGSPLLSALSWILAALLLLHAAVGVKLTADTIRACKKSGVLYFKGNKLFWARRVSGFAIFMFMLFHVALFLGKNEGAYRLKDFGGVQLAMQLFLVASVAVHVITNVKPMLIALGIRSLKEYAGDILLILSVLLIFTGLAFFIYYLRWNAV